MITAFYTASVRHGDRVYEATGATQFDAVLALQLGIVAKKGAMSDDVRNAVMNAQIRKCRLGDCRELESTEC